MQNIFQLIINKKAEANIIFEDDKCIAFYDKFPIQPGHFLVVPKKHSKNITEADDETAAHLINVARRLGKKHVLDKKIAGFKIIINTGEAADQTIFHTHVHVIPYREKVQDN
ncbi:histidine triad protein HinT [Mycoplasmopsis fermentans]|uniref:histidine triad protein HinT n=1 Tax=Mycoplasmopsis fermentans TaxID=2115 RepID=UPI0001E32FB6|nr:HIT family protein [Mycoplasmopsis fermentans]ADN69282.1 predicted HIT-family hydrolase protein [Mycoplasmopsis fermentans JER]RMX34798.1 histidine triad nucleotide-binding protein [Mycoplasmopsis fermentans MF-I1]RMX34862.1 histidine triad nucleotide-binding protein [Mycoplasmopsis fermentans MF-I2]